MLRVREMLPADLRNITPMFREMVEEAKRDPKFRNYPTSSEEGIERFHYSMMGTLKDPPPNFIGLSAVHGGEVKGFIVGLLENRFFFPYVFLSGKLLYVAPEFRKQGLANKLIHDLCALGLQMGAQAFELWAVPGTEGHKLWARAGFKTFHNNLVFASEDLVPITDKIPQLSSPPPPIEEKPPVPEETQAPEPEKKAAEG